MPDCWIGNASGGEKVFFLRRYQPQPPPIPKYQRLKSDHQFIGDLTGPGDLDDQDFGWGPGRITVTLPMIEQSHLDGVEALYFAWDTGSGRPARVQFNNGSRTWLCAWDGPWEPERLNSRRPLYKLELKLLIKEEVGE